MSSASTTICQVLPSEYAYHPNTLHRSEGTSANCRNYSPRGEKQSIHPEDYIHCDGTQLELVDSIFGSEEYVEGDYYVWPAGSSSQLLFIFLTKVNLTTITLHYYSDNIRGLPRLRFLAVPDDFEVWDAPTSSYSHVDVAAVPPDEEPAGHRNVSVGFEINTKKILLVKLSSTFSFALSEVEFIKGNIMHESTSVATYSNAVSANLSTTTASYIQTTTLVTEHKSSETSEFINL